VVNNFRALRAIRAPASPPPSIYFEDAPAMRLRLTIARAMVLFGLVTATGLAAVVFTGIYALGEVKVGGPIYDKIKLGNDLIADILPPPEYVIESYLEATLALNNPAGLAIHRDRLTQLKKEYDERR